MKFLVTGGAGFIGSHLCSYLANENSEVVAVDNFNNYYSPSLKRARTSELFRNKNIKLIEQDLIDYNSVKSMIYKESPNFVVHLAAQAGVRLPYKKYHLYTDANLNVFSNVINATLQAEIPNFIFASSSSVYGAESQTPYSENQENLSPISFYGATKLANEILSKSAAMTSNTKTRGLRFFTVYGPWGRPDMAYFRLIASGLNSHHFVLNGNGDILRDFTYIEDVKRLIFKLCLELDSRGTGFNDVVNVGGGNPISMSQAIKIIGENSPSNLDISYSESDLTDVAITEASNNYLKDLIGDVPATKFNEGVLETISWAKRQGITENLRPWIESLS
jgi:UDP-glucuronate 4-epimerase